MSEHFDTIVIGGGIAGVSALAELAQQGSALLIEREASLAAHASGRNAAIYRPLEHDQTTALLARRSLEILAECTNDPILHRVGLLLVARDEDVIAAHARHAIEMDVPHGVLDSAQCGARVTVLTDGDVAAGLLLPDSGVLDIHRMITVLAGVARDRGAQIRHRAEVSAIETRSGQVSGVRLADGVRLSASRVVIAAGAWASELGHACGSRVVLSPIRRHLMQLKAHGVVDSRSPVVWQVDAGHELYFRPESGGVLASACDEAVVEPGPTPVHPAALELLASKLSRTAPALGRSHVQHAWACLRTFAPDRELVVGADSTVPGLFWLAGLGGRGMAVAVGAAEVLGTLVASGEPHAVVPALCPSRI